MMMNGRRFLVIALGFAVLFAAGCRAENKETITPAPLVSITLRPSAPGMAPGTNLQLEAVGNYENGTTKSLTASVTWKSADPGVATVSSSGLVSAVDLGTTTITASQGPITGSTLLTASPLVSLALSPGDPTIAGGTTIQLTATGTLLNGSTQDLTSYVTWSSSNTAVASIAGSGLASATTATTGGTTITASFGAVSATTALTSADLTALSVTPLSASIVLGTSQQFTATGLLTGGFTQNLTSAATWSSSVPTIAVIGSTTVSPGLAQSVAAGSTVIAASFNGITSNAAALTVKPATLISLTVVPTNASIAVGNNQQFTATGAFSDGTSQDVTAAATWSSSSPAVVSVSNTAGTKGLASGLAVGTASVSATFSGVTSNSAAVTVTTSVLVSITVLPANTAVVVGSGRQFTAQGKFSDNTTQDITNTVTWSATNGIASISNATGSNGQLTALGAGTATVTATLGTVSGSTTLTITTF
jgi:Big-like domain-containing protein